MTGSRPILLPASCDAGKNDLNKTENHFSPYPRLRKKFAINCGRTAEELPDGQL
jgi:hypothetical protein